MFPIINVNMFGKYVGCFVDIAPCLAGWKTGGTRPGLGEQASPRSVEIIRSVINLSGYDS